MTEVDMAANQEGQRVPQEKVERMLAYHNAGIAAPEEFNDIVLDNSQRGELFYRYKTAEEKKAEEEASKAQKDAIERQTKMREEITAEAQKRGVPVVPERPTPDTGRPVEAPVDARNAGRTA